MENASQALIIAGGILLAILTISLLVYAFGNASTIFNAQDKEKEAQRLAEWNAEWEAYNRQLLYGTEVLTVVNKAEQNNSEYTADSDYRIYIEIKTKTETLNNKDDIITDIENKLKVFNTNIFKCTKMEHNPETGRVNIIEFEYVKKRI